MKLQEMTVYGIHELALFGIEATSGMEWWHMAGIWNDPSTKDGQLVGRFTDLVDLNRCVIEKFDFVHFIMIGDPANFYVTL